MGADIHVYIEAVNNDGEWEEIYLLDKDGDKVTWYPRDYSLFGLLGEVRGEGIEGYTQVMSGLPYDVSETILNEYKKYESSFFGATYYSLRDLCLFVQHLEEQINNLMKDYQLALFACKDKEWAGNIAEEIKLYEEYKGALVPFVSWITHVAYFNAFFSTNQVRTIIWFDN